MLEQISRGKKTEITAQLDAVSAVEFAKWIGCYSVIWNCKVAELKEIRRTEKRYRPSQAYAHYVTNERKWLEEVPSQIRRNAASKCVEAYKAKVQGIRGLPRFKNANSKRHCVITKELFTARIAEENIIVECKCSDKSPPFCALTVAKPENITKLPNMITISRKGSRFWLGFSYSAELELRDAQTIIDELREEETTKQQQKVVGIDVGVVTPVAISSKTNLSFTDDEIAELKRKQARKLHYQKKVSHKYAMAKKNGIKLGKNYQKAKNKLSDTSANIANIRGNMAHRVSKEIASMEAVVVVAEKLQIKNLTKKPKAKQDVATGKWLRNGARAKAGINKAILNVGWGKILNFAEYKLRANNKLLVYVPPQYSSQECLKCGYIAKENRKTQELFHCQQCNHQENADFNAAQVLKKRFLVLLNADKFVLPTKTVRRIAIRKRCAARIAVPVCGANIRPASAGCGEKIA